MPRYVAGRADRLSPGLNSKLRNERGQIIRVHLEHRYNAMVDKAKGQAIGPSLDVMR